MNLFLKNHKKRQPFLKISKLERKESGKKISCDKKESNLKTWLVPLKLRGWNDVPLLQDVKRQYKEVSLGKSYNIHPSNYLKTKSLVSVRTEKKDGVERC